jgi:cobalamin biosynthesis protein CobT
MLPERIQKLNSLGFVWGIKNRVTWQDRYNELLHYRSQHGNCNVPQQYKTNHSLGIWVDKQRQKHKKGDMSEEHQNLLNAIDFEWVRGKTPNRDYFKQKHDKNMKRDKKTIINENEKQDIDVNDNDSNEQSEEEEEEGSDQNANEYNEHSQQDTNNIHMSTVPAYFVNGYATYQRYWS